jgi:hypothetical protein
VVGSGGEENRDSLCVSILRRFSAKTGGLTKLRRVEAFSRFYAKT